MKILLVSEYFPPHIGGVEVVFASVAKGLVKQGHECYVVTCRVPNTPKYEEIDSVRIHRVNVPRAKDRYWFALLAIPIVLKLARNADLIHTTTFTAALPAWIAARLLRKKSIITVHEVWVGLWSELAGMNRFSAKLHRLLEKVIISLNFDKHVCVSRYTRNCLRLLGTKDDKLEVVYNGIDRELFNPVKAAGKTVRPKLGVDNEFVYMYYGRAGISKGLEYLIQAVPLVSHKIPNSKLLLILGDEPQERRKLILNMIETLSVTERIILLKPVASKELPAFIASADCVVIPSLSEGFGFTAAEACAMEKPVVATDVASLPEVVSSKHILVKPRSPQALADAIEKIHKGQANYIPPKNFTWEECVAQYLAIYKSLIPQK
jgi:D-inositol-3-phosphate glycosyltransferase